MRPNETAIAMFGFIIIIVKAAFVLSFVYVAFLFGIMGCESVRLGTNALEPGIMHLASHYYYAALYMTVCAISLVHFIKQTFTAGMFAVKDKTEEPNTEKKE